MLQLAEERDTMTLELQISANLEAQLRQQAAVTGQNVADFVIKAVEEKLAESNAQNPESAANDTDWMAKLRELIELHPVVTHVADDSRESIYAGRGE
jgi:uncharacterized protein (DUF1778 family)